MSRYMSQNGKKPLKSGVMTVVYMQVVWMKSSQNNNSSHIRDNVKGELKCTRLLYIHQKARLG